MNPVLSDVRLPAYHHNLKPVPQLMTDHQIGQYINRSRNTG